MCNIASKGTRISDSYKEVISVDLNDILKEVYGGVGYHWSIQKAYINGYKGINGSIIDLEKEAQSSELGKPTSWPELCALGNDVFQFIELILVGSKNPENNKWIKEPKEMYETPDVYIEMFDSCWWWVFSKDHDFINRLAHKFKDIELLEPDFREKRNPENGF